MAKKKDRGSATPLKLTPNAITVLEKRYLARDQNGAPVEAPQAMFERVAQAVASAEKKNRGKWESAFLELMLSRRFMPNSPTLMNAGRPKGQLSACFVLPVEDSLDGIFGTLKDAAKIHQSGGGTGFSFSALRPKGSVVQSTHGVASGPVSFISIYDTATETIKQGGARRGANMAVLRVDHPDIIDFIDSKRDHRSILNFNISVGVTDEFMKALESGSDYALRSPDRKRREQRLLPAREVFDRMIQAAWECGDPGVVFLDRINRFNPTPDSGEMESTNPCGEQPLLPYESCNLGSLNLGEYFHSGGIDWKRLAQDTATATRFLDDVIEINHYPVKASERITLRNRKIGLGVMGFADLLLMLGIPYDAREAQELGEAVMSFIDREAKSTSMRLAAEKGAFPNWKHSLWHRLGYQKMRNATVSTVAPTGTISIIAGASSGIEPFFAGIFHRNVLSGAKLLDVHPAVQRAFEERGEKTSGLSEERIAQVLGKAWRPAEAVSVENHVRMQARFQRHSDSAVSKTINLPESARPEDIAHAYRLAYRLGCKGITVYRDRSRPEQVLERVVPGGGNKGEAGFCPSC